MPTTAEYAARTGISERRVRALAQHGKLPARHTGRRWVIEDDAIAVVSAGTRPMSPRTRGLFLHALSDTTVEGLVGSDRVRIAHYLAQVRNADEPAALLRAWFRGAAAPVSHTLGEVLVRAAMRGEDDQVAARVRRARRRFLNSPARLARVVSDERAIHGLTRAELAERADTSEGDVRSIESGRPVSSLPTVLRIVRALDVQPLALPTASVEDSV